MRRAFRDADRIFLLHRENTMTGSKKNGERKNHNEPKGQP